MELDLADWIAQDIYLTGEYESTASTIGKKLLRPGDTAVDVGANIGYFSLLFAQCVGDAGRVLAYEPVPALVAKLKRNLKLNRLSNVSVSNLALSDRRGNARFYVGPEYNIGLSSLREPRQSSGSLEVELAPFDGLVEDCGKVTLVKIDVEGAELQVLRGMEKLLQSAHPHLLLEVTESFLREMGDSVASLLQFVGQFGYTCYVLGNRQLTPLTKSQTGLPMQWNAFLTTSNLFGDGVAFSTDRRKSRRSLASMTKLLPFCPLCGGQVTRIQRRTVDRLLSLIRPVRRYRCETFGCGWEGNLRYRTPPDLPAR